MPRSWYISPVIGERAYIDLERKEAGRSFSSFAYGFLGLTPEDRTMGIDSLLTGVRSRWFLPGEENVCILPQAMAPILGIDPTEVGQTDVWILGRAYRVIGLFDGDAADRLRDLDNESPMPVDTVAEARKMAEMAELDPRLMDSAAIESFTHLMANNVVLLPCRQVMDMGGSLRSIAIAYFAEPDAMLDRVEEFVSRVAVPIFVGEGERVRVYTSMGAAALSGIGNLFVPILIAALIVLNTMLGAVYERDREIGIYSSVGLAPNHIAALFIAEALVFATVGAVFGYLVGQTVSLTLARYGLLGGMFLNYSSLSAISTTGIVMAVVVLSTLYPARRAAAMSVPDVTRRWRFPEPEGDDWHFDFPFAISAGDAVGICSYLHRVFSSYGEGSVGDFMTEAVELRLDGTAGEPDYRLELMVWLAPYDLGVSQQVSLRMVPTEDIAGIYRIEIHLQRISGDVASWRRLNTGFLDVLRKRFLVWRTLPSEVQEEYLTAGRNAAALRGFQGARG